MTQSSQQLEAWLKKRGGWNGTKKSTKVSLFSLPIECVPCLAPASSVTEESVEIMPVKLSSAEISVPSSRGLTCIACKLTFNDVSEQQLHFKSDLHLINLKRRVHGLAAVLSGDVDTTDSIDASKDPAVADDVDEESDSGESDVDNDFEAAPQDASQPAVFANELGSIRKEFSAQRGPTLHLRDVNLPHWELVVSTGMFSTNSSFHSREWNTSSADSAKPSPWAQLSTQIEHIRRNKICGVFLLRSGRFAGAIFDGQTLLIHKVMRRYTVRAKAGGGQSSHDNKSGKAKSAGAMLRRYGEQALKEDIAQCLALWSGHIQSCSMILISAPKTMRSVLFDTPENPSSGGSNNNSTGGVLSKDDPRVAYVPFMVDRPTLDEAKMVHDRCTSVYFNRTDLASESGAEEASVDVGVTGILKNSVKFTKPESSANTKADAEKESVLYSPASKRVFEAIQSGNEEEALAVLQEVAALGAYEVYNRPGASDESAVSAQQDALLGDSSVAVHSFELSVVLDLVDGLEHLTTPLHAAAAQGMAAVVALLLTLGASPMPSDIRGRTAYYIAKDKDTRDAFRRFRATPEGEDRWDWNAAGVGAALSEETEQAKKAREKEKEKEKKKRAAQRKKDAKAKEEEEAQQAAQNLIAQQEEARQRAEHARTSAGVCASCNTPLFGKQALDLYDYKCCGGACVMALRRRLQADAAMKRFQS